MTKTTLIAAIALATGLVASTVGAEARRGHHHHRHHGVRIILGAPLYAAPVYGYRHRDCSYEYVQWRATASYYWKQRYYNCKGWW